VSALTVRVLRMVRIGSIISYDALRGVCVARTWIFFGDISEYESEPIAPKPACSHHWRQRIAPVTQTDCIFILKGSYL